VRWSCPERKGLKEKESLARGRTDTLLGKKNPCLLIKRLVLDQGSRLLPSERAGRKPVQRSKTEADLVQRGKCPESSSRLLGVKSASFSGKERRGRGAYGRLPDGLKKGTVLQTQKTEHFCGDRQVQKSPLKGERGGGRPRKVLLRGGKKEGEGSNFFFFFSGGKRGTGRARDVPREATPFASKGKVEKT